MGKFIVAAFLAVSLMLSPVFADDVSQVLGLYGHYKPVDIEKEKTTLSNMLNEYYTLSKEVSGIEMSQIATKINEEQHISLLAFHEKQVIEKEAMLIEIRYLISKNSEEPVEDLLTLEAEYLTAELDLKNAKLQLDQIKAGKTEIFETDSNIGQLKYELNKKNNRVKTQKSKVEKATSFPEIGNSRISKYPLNKNSYITSDFGKRTDPIDKKAIQFHAGIDLHAATDTKVTSAYNGTVEKVGFDKALGHFVLVDHGKGLKTIYGHLNSYIVHAGDSVAQYQHIAYSGNSGSRSTGPHLHFGVYIYGEPVDPKVIVKR
jgi:murein DD-endopeptidase MepM/ murein hydrolase activator NlpD